MLLKFLKKQIANFLTVVLVFPFLFYSNNSFAAYDGPREPITYNSDARSCDADSLGQNPYGYDKDINWELTNPVCLSFMAIQGALIFGAGTYVDDACIANNQIGVVKLAAEKAGDPIPDTPFITPNVAYKISYRLGLCVNRISEVVNLSAIEGAACSNPATVALCPEATRQVGLAVSDSTRCCSSYGMYAAAVGTGLAALATIYATAKGAYENSKICGNEWNVWSKVNVNGDPDPSGDIWRLGKFNGSYQQCIESLFIDNLNPCSLPDVDGVPATKIDLKNKYYREYLYGGQEFEDKGSGSCENPSSWDSKKRIASLGYDDSAQRYYMRGPGVASNYACHRFVLAKATDLDKASVAAAYDCCKERSQSTICIENAPLIGGSSEHKFCPLGDRCNVKGVWFEPYPSKSKVNYICAKTYSVCPYNHLLGGGTEIEEFVKDPQGHDTSNTKNFCQVLKHCAKIPVLPYIRISDLDGAYISSACKDMKGDTQNVYDFNVDLQPISNRGFSAPLVQCFKETMENLLLNKAGDTKCVNPDEEPTDGVCQSGYFYKKGTSLTQSSFFVKIQQKLQFAIKMALTLSIIFMGVVVLYGVSAGQGITKKQLLGYVMKIGLVMYFALGDAWQFGLVDGILGSSNYISDIMMRVEESPDPAHQDGCQFPKFNYADNFEETKFNNPSYPPRKEYLKIWDTLDCKFARAIGFGPEVSVPNLVVMIIAGAFTGAYGLIFLVATFIFAFFLFSLILRAIHIFLMAMIAIVTLIYVSPITITLSLFSRTKGIFDGWWKQLLGFALQPVILFAYLGIFIALFDRVVIGDAAFRGDGQQTPKQIVCEDYRICIPGNTCSDQDLKDPTKTQLVSVENSSIYCIFKVAKLKTYSGFEIIGIGIPILTSLNVAKVNSIIKAAFLMFIFSEFMDKISTLAAKLVGGEELKSGTAGAAAIAGGAYGVARGIQSRGVRGLKKHVAPRAQAAADKIKEKIAKLGDLGKSVDPGVKREGATAADRSDKGAAKAALSSTEAVAPGDKDKSR